MNVKLVESLAEIVHSLTAEEKLLLAQKVKQDLEEEPSPKNGDRPFYETASPQERAQAFREWAESHRGNDRPSLSDEAISRESIYGERG